MGVLTDDDCTILDQGPEQTTSDPPKRADGRVSPAEGSSHEVAAPPPPQHPQPQPTPPPAQQPTPPPAQQPTPPPAQPPRSLSEEQPTPPPAQQPRSLSEVGPGLARAPPPESTVGGGSTCVVCFEGEKNHVAVPCGHLQVRSLPWPTASHLLPPWLSDTCADLLSPGLAAVWPATLRRPPCTGVRGVHEDALGVPLLPRPRVHVDEGARRVTGTVFLDRREGCSCRRGDD